jgi:hypothetical protein
VTNAKQNNIALFNVWTIWILGELYRSFPAHRNFAPRRNNLIPGAKHDFAYIYEDAANAFVGLGADDAPTETDSFDSAVKWLRKEGLIEYERPRDEGMVWYTCLTRSAFLLLSDFDSQNEGALAKSLGAEMLELRQAWDSAHASQVIRRLLEKAPIRTQPHREADRRN